MASSKHRAYAAAGVDLAARSKFAASLGGILARTRRPEVLSDAGPFSGLFQMSDKYDNPVIAASADGVGTKVKLLQAANRVELCGPDIVGHCVDDILTSGAEPLFFLDYIAGNALTNETKTALVEGVADACAAVNCALLGGETADMPDVYAPGDFDLAGFIVGVVEKDRIIDGSKVSDGDVLLGLASSGLHTNGYTLARKVLSVADGEPAEETRRRLEERPPVLNGDTIEDHLLATHIPYNTVVGPVLDKLHGIAHITGGGYPENVARVLPEGLAATIDTRTWAVPGIFQLIQQRGEIAVDEMYEVFNMGIGLVLVVDPDDVEEVTAQIPEAVRVGSIKTSSGKSVELEGI